MTVVLDTHALLWWQNESSKLSPRARSAIQRSRRVCFVTTSLWEVGMLVGKGRIGLDRDPFEWLQTLIALGVADVVDPRPEAMLAAGLLPSRGFHGDPADAVIYSTARELGAVLVTKDQRMRTFARESRELKTIW